MPIIQVLVSPDEVIPEADVWLVVDLLRATTTITTFFERGGRLLLPVATVQEARVLREQDPSWLLMGERNALPPKGFDLGNSPRELIPEILSRRPMAVMTTTNGTRALARVASQGVPVLAACARNAGAVVRKALSMGERLGVLCAGRFGRQALDDTACAGLLVELFREMAPTAELDDGALLALAFWRQGEGKLESLVRQAGHSRFLEEIGLGEDIRFCCEVNRSSVVPVLKGYRGYHAFRADRPFVDTRTEGRDGQTGSVSL